VGDSDDVYYRAVKAGFTVLMPIQDASWGDRFGKLKDPYGHTWSIATSRWVYTPEELEAQELRPTG
jgi:uncharacterized glyoxalase superfamily protein PhnB